MPVEPGRHYTGGRLPVGAWKCPSCGTEHTTPFEKGCGACGAGTPEQVERALAERQAAELPDASLYPALVGVADGHTALLAAVLTHRARLSVARALAHYADTGTPGTDELSRAQLLTWARKIVGALDQEDDEDTHG